MTNEFPLPSVTLTFAQSVDGAIGVLDGKQLVLSGSQSMEMTHSIRREHDAILVGVGTVLNDNPGLNVRLPTQAPLNEQPIPIILDSNLRTPTDAKFLGNFRLRGTGAAPYIIHSVDISTDKHAKERSQALIDTGANLLKVESVHDFKGILKVLAETLKIKSLMVEGGASVISSLLKPDTLDLISKIIITIAPTFIGSDGVRPKTSFQGLPPSFTLTDSKLVGPDYVITFEHV